MLHWLWVVLIGLVIGVVAKLIMPGKDPGGFIITILLGIAGSVVATWIGRAVGWYAEGQSAGFIMSVIGAIVLLVLYRLIKPRTATGYVSEKKKYKASDFRSAHGPLRFTWERHFRVTWIPGGVCTCHIQETCLLQGLR